jgi:predicted RND superfamily exporter protein
MFERKDKMFPWYDAEPVSFLLLLITSLSGAFSVLGMRCALASPQYRHSLWFPALLFALSLAGFTATLVRIQRQRREKDRAPW